LPHLVAEADLAIGRRVGQEDAPAILGHLGDAVVRPALRIDRDRGAQVDVGRLEVARPHSLPPFDEMRLPVLERALQRAVAHKVDVVRDLLGVVDAAHYTRSQSYLAFAP